MRNITVLFLCCCFVFQMNGQDTYRKRYFVKERIVYNQEVQSKKIKAVKPLYLEKYLVNKNTDQAGKVTLDTTTVKVKFSKLNLTGDRLKANLLFEKNKIYVNPWLIVDKKGRVQDASEVYHYTLRNRQSLKLNFQQWALSALVIPIKVRAPFRNRAYFAQANVGLFFGHTWGQTNFVHRTKIGNHQYDKKISFGGYLGFEKLNFKFQRFEGAPEEERNTALMSWGLGILTSYQNFSIGLLGGVDLGLGNNVTEWTYHGKYWMGLSVGYALFSI